MLSGEMVSMLITSGVVGGVLGFMATVTTLKRKGIDIGKGINVASTIIEAAEPVMGVASALLPNNPSIDFLKSIEKWATIVVGHAQQLYYAGSIEKDERKKIAEDAVYKVLEELNIELTDSRKTLINAAIENAVGSLGHTEPTEAERVAKGQALQAQVSQLTTENTKLKNAITAAASTVQSTVQNK